MPLGGYRAAPADRDKLQFSDPPGKTWLFHLATDPPSSAMSPRPHPNGSGRLRQLQAEHNARQAAPLWPSSFVSPVNIDRTLLEPDAPDDQFICWFN